MKTAIVTGASGNMGQAVVKKFIDEGYYVVGTIVPNDTVPLNFATDKFEKIVVDLMDEDATQQFVNNISEKNTTIDAAVLTVGGFAMGDIAHTKTTDVMKQYKLNFETAYNIARPVFIKMLEQNNGRIFLVGSRPGLNAQFGKGTIAYGLAKSLIFRLAELMNEEAKGKNVVVNVVVPSTIDTPPNRKSMPDADFAKWVQPEDIANVIYFHCTDNAKTLRETIIKVYNNS